MSIGGFGDRALVRRRPGVWTTTVRVERRHKPGRYSVGFANLDDGLHTIAYFGPEVPSVHGNATVRIISPQETAAPRVIDLRLGSAVVDATSSDQSVPITAHVTDDGSGATVVDVNFSVVGAIGSSYVSLRRAAGSAWDGTWTGTLNIPSPAPSSMPSGVWTFEVVVGDRAHHYRTITAAELAAQGLPSSLTMKTRPAEPEPEPPLPAPAPPVIRDVRQSTSVVDVRRHDARIVVTARVTDVKSAVTEVGLTDARGEIEEPMHLVSGDGHDGIWRRTIVVHRCTSVRGPVTRNLAAVNDRREASAAEDAVGYRIRAADVVPPHIVAVEPYTTVSPTGPVRIAFDEDVTGISGRSALIVLGPDPRHEVKRGPVVPGTWRCETGTSQPVNCLHGPVRAATWTPRDALRSLTYYSIVMNPEHVIAVTDLHGNATFESNSFTTG